MDNSGSNGLAVDAAGFIIAATHDRKELSRYDRNSGKRTTIVGEYNGKPFNSPNDLTLTDEGIIYFTDPDFQRSAAPGGQPKTRIYQVQSGTVTAVDDTLNNPNGVSLSPARDVLYVAGGGQDGVLRAYPVVNGAVGHGADLVTEIATPDGMAIDCQGNIYVTEHASQRIRVFSPQGKELAVINVDGNVTNAAFGGQQWQTLYITGAGALWSIELDVAGFPY